MVNKTRGLSILFASTVWAGALACSGGDTVEPVGEQPEVDAKILALSTYSASVGALVEVYGTDFPKPAVGRTYLRFNGVFEGADGTREAVDYSTEPRRVDSGTLRWDQFGPYRNPFSQRGAVGTFVGTVSTRVVKADGQVVDEANPMEVTFEVKPSVLVEEFQPTTATCDTGILRGIGGAAYRLGVQAVGFEPESFTYAISAPALQMEPIRVRQLADGTKGEVGRRGDIILPEVPEGVPSYGAVITILARGKAGEQVQSSFGLTVHRPLEVFYNGFIDVAEVLAPVPVSGCMPGGTLGASVDYSESQAESRNRSYSVNWNEGWVQSHTVSQGSSETIGLSERNGIGFSTTNGTNFNWSLGAEVTGSVGVDKLVQMGVGVSSEVGGGGNQSNTQNSNRETGVDASTTTTDSESVSEGNSGSTGEDFSWSVSSSQVISRGFGGWIIPGTYGVFYRQTLRLMRRAAMVAYNQCGYAQVVGEVDFVDWTWSPDLALGESCPPLPQSNLPDAECNISPCTGQ